MRIAIMGHNPVAAFSGGRYYAWMMAEGLATRGHDVAFITDNRPFFYDDFAGFPAHEGISLFISPNMWDVLPDGGFDLVFVVPTSNPALGQFLRAIVFARERGARLALLNFESGNWYNALSPEPRDLARWRGWERVSRDASLIMSLAAEGDKYARTFYKFAPKTAMFAHCHSCINTIVADTVPDSLEEKRIILITRFAGSSHKGGAGVLELIDEAMRGYTIVLLVGSGEVPKRILDELRRRSDACGANLEVKYRLSERDKFAEIKRCSLMLFPSFFEGFGLPPVEAQYCNVPCIAFDLPVLREVSGGGLYYVRPGDWEGFRSKIAEVLAAGASHAHLREHIAKTARFEAFADRMDAVVNGALAVPLDNGLTRRLRLSAELCLHQVLEMRHWPRRRIKALYRRIRKPA